MRSSERRLSLWMPPAMKAVSSSTLKDERWRSALASSLGSVAVDWMMELDCWTRVRVLWSGL